MQGRGNKSRQIRILTISFFLYSLVKNAPFCIPTIQLYQPLPSVKSQVKNSALFPGTFCSWLKSLQLHSNFIHCHQWPVTHDFLSLNFQGHRHSIKRTSGLLKTPMCWKEESKLFISFLLCFLLYFLIIFNSFNYLCDFSHNTVYFIHIFIRNSKPN